MKQRQLIVVLVVLGWFAAGIALPLHLAHADGHHDAETCSLCQGLLLTGLGTFLVVLLASLDRPIVRHARVERRLAPIVVHAYRPLVPRGPPA